MTATAISLSLVGAFKGLSLGFSSSSGDFESIHVSHKVSVSFPLKSLLKIEYAHKKGAGSTKNGRDSAGKRLGVKIYGDQVAKPGAIIVRQRGTKFHPGKNVGLGKDHTIFSLIDGLVRFENFGPDRKQVSVYPHAVQLKNHNSYSARKSESFRLQSECRKARKVGIVAQPQLILASVTDNTENKPNC